MEIAGSELIRTSLFMYLIAIGLYKNLSLGCRDMQQIDSVEI